MKSFFVIGLGRFGRQVAASLCQQGCEVLVIDSNSELVQQVSDSVTQAVVGDARDKEVLRALDAKSFDCGIVAIGESLADSVLATMNLKELGVPYVVCKAQDETHKQVLLKLGADRVVIPEKEQASRLAKSLSATNVLDYIELSEDFGIVETPAPAKWDGKSLIELNVRANLGVNILAVKRNGGITVSPSADFRVEDGDVLVVLGEDKALKALQKL
ncbi:MAG: TrkA family potassium uptake protein [Oscillospiraceae bacterium]|nr:TrkA family potassium uptake protein [Oscillospiraceae bacterium]